jgi:hypothetical protein
MTDQVIACIRVGTHHSIKKVVRLRDCVAENLDVPCTVACFTDQPDVCDGVIFIDITDMELTGHWARLLLFEPGWRGQARVIFFDLDIAIVGNITPLTTVPGEFTICEDPRSPYGYHSDVMVIGGGMAGFVWSHFNAQQEALMQKHTVNACIEALYPSAALLQDLMPKGFFFDRRGKTATGSVGL